MARPRKNTSTVENDGQQQDLIVTENRLLTVGEVARRLRVDSTTVRRWISQGTLEAIPLPHNGKRRVYRIQQSTLDSLLGAGLPPIDEKE